MAAGDGSDEVRVLQNLRGKIYDAKHLMPNKMRDFFCTINLDQEEVFRTQVVEKSLSPYFGEEFYFEIPRTFQWLSFYIYDKSVLQKDLRIGKVSIKKEDLCNYTGKENWFMLQPIDSNSEVQGKVHLELKLNELITDNGSVCQQLVVHIKECHGLPLINGQNCDPYATVSLVGPSRVDLWNNGNLVQDVFLGEIKVPVKVLRNDSFQAWYLLQPRENGNKSSKTDDLGSLRLNICYTEDYVLPSEYYTSLRNLLLKSSDVQPISASAAYILSEVCRDKYDAVLPLVRLLLHHHKLVPFVAAVAELDLKDTQEANTVFRGNSLATRCVDEMMKIVGKHYLKVTLKPVIDEICESPKPCEIDPIKLREGDNVEINMENLRYYVGKVFSEIVRSSISCPTLMCDVFYSLRHLAAKRFPNDPHVQYSAVSSFVFLRFFAVAVVSPHTFHLRPHHPDAQTCRTLTLISKAIQTLGSWGSLTKSKLSSFKETFMCEFFKTFQEEKFTESVKKFLDDVSSTESKEPSGMSEPVHLKEGEMYKRAQGRTRIGKKNFKKRWFCLTSREFTYHKQQDKEPIFTIPIKNILAVEKLDESSFNKKNMFQVLHGEKPLYIQANNCVEASEWIEALCRVTRCNQKRLSFYHPSAFLNGSWLCCKATTENTVGCARCTADVPADTQIEIDGDRETERIYSLFTINMSKLQKLEEACGSIAVYQGPRKEPDDYSNFTIEDSVATFHTLKQIIDTVEKLNESHDKYRKKRSSSAKYGSEENPIVGKVS
ncbi:ras GTPase-activating protein 2 isoform X3 [Apus apus]|uniref:ras GTPase-activating protein 2 isoform X3 n=1 Tax=Apus apus TaxID=8895 RepID=UPI0021F8C7D3|nr:ras GTPase-activating protein 2 isoform X3 [Apus apus]